MQDMIKKLARHIQARRLGYRASQLSFAADGSITETATGRAICPFINAPVEIEQQDDHTLIRVFAPNSNIVVDEAIGLEGEAA